MLLCIQLCFQFPLFRYRSLSVFCFVVAFSLRRLYLSWAIFIFNDFNSRQCFLSVKRVFYWFIIVRVITLPRSSDTSAMTVSCKLCSNNSNSSAVDFYLTLFYHFPFSIVYTGRVLFIVAISLFLYKCFYLYFLVISYFIMNVGTKYICYRVGSMTLL